MKDDINFSKIMIAAMGDLTMPCPQCHPEIYLSLRPDLLYTHLVKSHCYHPSDAYDFCFGVDTE